MVISTNGGLWRYLIGDTVRFTSLSPHRIQISGRTKHYINAFGEELMIDNVETALKRLAMLLKLKFQITLVLLFLCAKENLAPTNGC
jgi:non-ribosomal peptide synthetase component E (peptide arylation enzyme)